MEGLAGILLLYLALVGVGVLSVTLWGELTRGYVQNLRQRGASVFWRGIIATALLTLLIAVLIQVVKQVANKQPIELLMGLLLLAYALTALVGFGATLWHLGERTALAFGKAELAPGWAIMLGVALVLSVVWIPVFGWALGVYWLAQSVGNVVAGVGLPATSGEES
ncbi:MAG: hypothetical protein N2045_02060 [Fimbriimonadales bacterium]|nr:hypothetical protein [Fimbriimonadales bacterium]GBC89486.1 hypothetical protein HRbin14_00211 [bacterium HR14]GIV13450.1 MAG: hypothetical protein KatS3mg021_1732 [Fimbriimonadales bacterium]